MKRHLKKIVLRFLADGREATAREIARNVRAEARSIASYLRRLERYGLVFSGRFAGREIEWQISDKGRARLRWFDAHPRYDFMRRRLRA